MSKLAGEKAAAERGRERDTEKEGGGVRQMTFVDASGTKKLADGRRFKGREFDRQIT